MSKPSTPHPRDSPEAPTDPTRRSSQNCRRSSSRNSSRSSLPPADLKRPRSSSQEHPQRRSTRLRTTAVTQAEVRSESSRSSPRRFGRAVAASHSGYNSSSDSFSNASCGSDDDYTPGPAEGMEVGSNGVTRTRRRQTDTGGRDVGPSGIASPPLSHISSDCGPFLEGSYASFTEWPLHDASLKRVMVNGKATFQLQFAWDLDAESGHRHQPAKNQRTKRAASTRQGKFTPEEDELLIKLKGGQGGSWNDIHRKFAEVFPRRSLGSLQVHYSTHLKDRKNNNVEDSAD